MIVAVNTRFLLDTHLEGFGYFSREVLRRMVQQHPEHQFHFFFDRPFLQDYLFAHNVTGHVLSPQTRHPLLWKYWFDVAVTRRLRRIGADVFLSPDGQCSLTTRVPQCLVVHDLGFLHHPEGYQGSHLAYYKYFTPKFVRRAQTVATVSGFSRNDIVSKYGTDPAKISVVYNGVKEIFRPFSFDEKMAVKEKYTDGAEYFLYTGAIQPRKNLVNLLKAYSVFKRRLQSSLKLVLAGRLAWKNDEFRELLKTYKYKDDVVLTGYLPEEKLAPLTASAYAMVYPSFFEGFGVPVAEAMRCGVPVLTSKDSAMEEISGGAALYFDPDNVDDLAYKLMFIYKNEGERKELLENALPLSEQYTWERTAALLWEAVERAAK
ncbi:glycosyltransferase family 4 protein [Flavisolibacter sp. BT320]|nr:glycosyltransferase family 4 protein [Flavisolibacter longurius]